MPVDGAVEEQSEADEIDTKLNLAKAYIELGDNDGARSILDEVVRDGSEEQQVQAKDLLGQLS
jgi:pilus assembly protein FimV